MLLSHAIVPAMKPATVCLVSLIQSLLDELHHVRSVLGHPVVKCYHASEHDDRFPMSASRPTS